MATSYQVTIGEETVTVTLRRDGNTTYARIGDAMEEPVRLDTVQGVLRSLTVGDRRVELLASRMAETADVAVHGFSYTVEVQDQARARLAAVAGAGHAARARSELKAPMPGLVVKVLGAPGDAVTKGQPLVVLQAMKMENELSAPQDGTIAEVRTQAGQTVNQGQVLVVLD